MKETTTACYIYKSPHIYTQFQILRNKLFSFRNWIIWDCSLASKYTWNNQTNATWPHHQGSSFHKTVAPQIYATYLVSCYVSQWSHRGFPTHVWHSSIPFQGKHHEEFFSNCKDLPATGELSRVFFWYQKMNKSSEPLKGENKLRNTFQNQSVGWFLTMEAADRLRNTISYSPAPASEMSCTRWLTTASCENWSTKHTTYGSQKASKHPWNLTNALAFSSMKTGLTYKYHSR